MLTFATLLNQTLSHWYTGNTRKHTVSESSDY